MVVGMHRSGTSFLTGSLQQAGLELGKHSAWNPHNLKGNRENQDIVAFHDEVLAARDAAWDRPPSVPVVWTEVETCRAAELVAEYQGVEHWGFKDPRALLMVDAWRQLLPELRFVGIFRNPVAVARSLAARGTIPQAQAFALWTAYNRNLLALHRRSPFPLLCFDEDENVLHQKLDQILVEMGLQPLHDERFFSSELKHHRQPVGPLPAEQDALYRALHKRAR
ncbi:MAG: sulfotransferase [Pseudomonas sp.]